MADAGGPYYANINEKIEFDGSKSSDDGIVKNYTWEFGDGSHAYGKIVSHSYDKNGIYTVNLTVIDESGKKSFDREAVFIQPWKTGNEWIFDINNINVSSDSFSFIGKLKNLRIKVRNGMYNLNYKGYLGGDFSYNGQPSLNVTGKLVFSILNGNIILSKNFSIEKIEGKIFGIAILKFQSNFLIPIPFKVCLNMEFKPRFSLIDFPLYVGKE